MKRRNFMVKIVVGALIALIMFLVVYFVFLWWLTKSKKVN
jgi:hypothetical protein